VGIQRTQSCARCPHLAEGGSVRARLLDVRPHLRYILHLRLTPFWPPLAENMFEIRRSTTRAGHVYKESRSSTIGALSVVSRYLPLFFRRVRNRWGGGSDVISVGGPPNVRPMRRGRRRAFGNNTPCQRGCPLLAGSTGCVATSSCRGHRCAAQRASVEGPSPTRLRRSSLGTASVTNPRWLTLASGERWSRTSHTAT